MSFNQSDNLNILFITAKTEYTSEEQKLSNPKNLQINLHITRSTEILTQFYITGKEDEVNSADIILLDRNLPENELKSIIQYLQNDAELADIPYILIVKSFEEKQALKKKGIDVNLFIALPVYSQKLIPAIYSNRPFWLSMIRSQRALMFEK